MNLLTVLFFATKKQWRNFTQIRLKLWPAKSSRLTISKHVTISFCLYFFFVTALLKPKMDLIRKWHSPSSLHPVCPPPPVNPSLVHRVNRFSRQLFRRPTPTGLGFVMNEAISSFWNKKQFYVWKLSLFNYRFFCKNYRFSKTVLYIINRKIHGFLEIPDLFLVLSMISPLSHSFGALTREISCSTLEINLVFPRNHVLFSIFPCFVHEYVSLWSWSQSQTYPYCARNMRNEPHENEAIGARIQ
jgi:hypothetical protein